MTTHNLYVEDGFMAAPRKRRLIPWRKADDEGPSGSEALSTYMESLIVDGYKREYDKHESVWHTMPIFAGALGVISVTIGSIASRISFTKVDLYDILLAMLISGAFSCLIVSFVMLFLAIRPRSWPHPPLESSLLEWTAKLASHYDSIGYGPDKRDAAILVDLRAHVTSEFATAASQIRQLNHQRSNRRAWAMMALMGASAIAFALVAISFTHDNLYHPSAAPRVGGNNMPKPVTPSSPGPSKPAIAPAPAKPTPPPGTKANYTTIDPPSSPLSIRKLPL